MGRLNWFVNGALFGYEEVRKMAVAHVAGGVPARAVVLGERDEDRCVSNGLR